MKAVILVLLLTGCATPEQRGAYLGNICERYGFAPNTTGYDHCKIGLMNAHGYAPAQTAGK